MPKFVKPVNSESICIQFHCGECKKQYLTTIDDFSKSFVCSRCKAVVNTLPIFCQYQDQGCYGRYIFRCGGTIRKLSDDERVIEEKKAFDSELDMSVGARPTGSFHEDMQDIRGSTTSYRCDKCGDSYTLSQAVASGVDSGNEKCQRITCDTCGRFPEPTGLPEPDEGVDNSPLDRYFYK